MGSPYHITVGYGYSPMDVSGIHVKHLDRSSWNKVELQLNSFRSNADTAIQFVILVIDDSSSIAHGII